MRALRSNRDPSAFSTQVKDPAEKSLKRAEIAIQLREGLLRLGPTFIKLGQLLSTRYVTSRLGLVSLKRNINLTVTGGGENLNAVGVPGRVRVRRVYLSHASGRPGWMRVCLRWHWCTVKGCR